MFGQKEAAIWQEHSPDNLSARRRARYNHLTARPDNGRRLDCHSPLNSDTSLHSRRSPHWLLLCPAVLQFCILDCCF